MEATSSTHRLSMVAAAFFVSIALSAPALARDKKPELVVAEIPEWKEMQVSTDAPVLLRWRSGFTKDTIRMPAGAAKPTYQIEMDGRSFALVPADYWSGEGSTGIPGLTRHSDHGGGGWVRAKRSNDIMEGCYWDTSYFIAIDLVSQAVSATPVVHSEKNPERCRGGFFQKGPWSLAKAGSLEPAGAVVTVSFHATQDDARIAEAAKLEAESIAAQQDLQRRTALNDKKREIGAKLCKQRDDGFVEVAYTERVSPDNGKVQLRVSGAFDGRGFRRDVAEEIIWTDPTYWDLCE